MGDRTVNTLGFGAVIVVVSAVLLGTGAMHSSGPEQVELAKEQLEAMDDLRESMSLLRKEMIQLSGAVARRHQEETAFLKILWLTRYSKKKPPHDLARKIAKIVCLYAKVYDRDPDLVLSIINHESDFNPKARSKINPPAVGLMQLMPHWKKLYHIKGSLEDPETSIRFGLLILGSYEDIYGDLETAIVVYNRGPSPVDWDLIRNRSPKNKYVRDIMKTYRQLQALRVD